MPLQALLAVAVLNSTSLMQSPDFKGTTNQVQIKAPFTQNILLCGDWVACALTAARIFMKGTAGYRLRCSKVMVAVPIKGGKGRQRKDDRSRVGWKIKNEKTRCLSTMGESRWEQELCLVAASSSSPLSTVCEACTIPVGLLLAVLSAQERYVPQVSAMGPPTIVWDNSDNSLECGKAIH